MRETLDCYRLFEKHMEAFNTSETFTEFIEKANLMHLEKYAGGWVENAFETMKAGKKTNRGLLFPKANKFSDLFQEAFFIPTDSKDKPQGSIFVSGNAGFSRHAGGKRGYSERTPGTRSHYGAKFYGTYVIPKPEIHKHISGKYNYSFEAIKREDGILIIANLHDYIGGDWIALLDVSEDIRSLFDTDTQEMLSKERQAEIEVWGESRF